MQCRLSFRYLSYGFMSLREFLRQVNAISGCGTAALVNGLVQVSSYAVMSSEKTLGAQSVKGAGESVGVLLDKAGTK